MTRRTALLLVLLLLSIVLLFVCEIVDRVKVRTWVVDAGSNTPLPKMAVHGDPRRLV